MFVLKRYVLFVYLMSFLFPIFSIANEEIASKVIVTKKYASKETVVVGEKFSYLLEAKNSSLDEVATDVKVAIDLDTAISYIDNSSKGWKCRKNKNHLTCRWLSPLKPQESTKPIMIGVKASDEDEIITAFALSSKEMPKEVRGYISVDSRSAHGENFSLQMQTSDASIKAGGAYSYLLSLSNAGRRDAKGMGVVLKTVQGDYFNFDHVEGKDWSCSQSGAYVRCHHDSRLKAGANTRLKIYVNAPTSETTIDVKAELTSEYIEDSDISDNVQSSHVEVMEYGDFRKDNVRKFTKTLIAGKEFLNIHGDILTVGNQALCLGGGSGVCREPNAAVNDWVNQTRANLDSIKVYDTSTMATLKLDARDEVLWAGLYWMGMIDRNRGDGAKIQRADSVYLRHDSNSSYMKVTSNPKKFNWKNDKSFGVNIFGYQGVKDVTEYVKEHRSGDYWVADIQTSQGKNLSAGWALVVVVHDRSAQPVRELKNLTLFDGFQSVWKNDRYSEASQYPDFVRTTVDGFLTPKYGKVNSYVSYFALEGDKSLKDQISVTQKDDTEVFLSDQIKTSDDVMNGTITNPYRLPKLANTSGVDLDTLNVSSVIGNAQHETKLTIYSQGDRFYLGMFNFSTNMYLPNICYEESMTTANYQPLSPNKIFTIDDDVGFDLFIRNDDDEPARESVLRIEVDNLFANSEQTLEVKNIAGKWQKIWKPQKNTIELNATDINNSINDQNETVHQTIFHATIGRGANKKKGGMLKKNDKVWFRYHGRIDGIPDANQTRNVYKISFNINYDTGNDADTLKIKDAEIKPCKPLDREIQIIKHQPKGFDVTRAKGGFHKGEYDDATSVKSHLLTQLVHEDFQAAVLALDEERKIQRAHRGVVRIDLVEQNVSTSCENYPLLESSYLAFDDAIRKQNSFNHDNASQQALYRISYPVDIYNRYARWNGLDINDTAGLHALQEMLRATFRKVNYPCRSACDNDLDSCRECVFSPTNHLVSKVSCSSDLFAIRPKDIEMRMPVDPLLGGKGYPLSLDANASGYDAVYPTSSTHLKSQLLKPAGCMLSDENVTYQNSLHFHDGMGEIPNFSYANIGSIMMEIEDGSWTQVDQNSSSKSWSDCVVGSMSNSANADGKIGCDINSSEVFTFVPHYFENDVNLDNAHSRTFTYIDGTGVEHANANLTISARLYDGSLATNYTAGCFAKDIAYHFNTTPLIAGKIMSYYADKDAVKVSNNPDFFRTNEGNFSLGVTRPIIGINFARDSTIPQNPFDLNVSLLDINVTDGDVDGSGFAHRIGGARFYYGHLYAPNYLSIGTDTFKSKLFYEVYCAEGCDKTAFALNGLSESPDHVDWYVINAKHTGASYDMASVQTSHGLSVLSKGVFDLNVSIGANARPFCDRVSLAPVSWLRFDKYSASQASTLRFKTCFVSQGIWTGKGDVGMTVDDTVSNEKNSKLNW